MAKRRDRIDDLVDQHFDSIKSSLSDYRPIHEIQAALVQAGVDPDQSGAVVGRAQKRIRLATARRQGFMLLAAGMAIMALGLGTCALMIESRRANDVSGSLIALGAMGVFIGIYRIRGGRA